MLDILWGLKTVALFDVWSFEHILSGISVGSSVKKNNHKMLKKHFDVECEVVKTKYFDYVGVLFIAYFWETIEHYLETGLLGSRVQYWLQGVEFWGNRVITDPLMLIVGYLIAKKFPRLVIPARILSFIWLFVHIFVFPHSMYLQEVLAKLF